MLNETFSVIFKHRVCVIHYRRPLVAIFFKILPYSFTFYYDTGFDRRPSFLLSFFSAIFSQGFGHTRLSTVQKERLLLWSPNLNKERLLSTESSAGKKKKQRPAAKDEKKESLKTKCNNAKGKRYILEIQIIATLKQFRRFLVLHLWQ